MKRILKILIVLFFMPTFILVFWNISLGQQGTSPQTHAQPPTTFSSSLSGKIAVNYYSNPTLVDHGYVLNQVDKVCVGDTLKISSVDLGGEWFGKGGPNDSPPITWVSSDEMDNIINNINNYLQTHTLPPETTVNSLPDTIVSNKEALGMEITLYKAPLFTARIGAYPWAYGTLICTANTNLKLNGQPYSGSEISVSNEGQLQFDVTAQPKCYFYLEKTITDHRNKLTENYYYSLSDVIVGPTISNTINLAAVKDSNGPNFEISRFSLTPDNYVRLLITNNGGMTGTLDYVGSNVPLTVSNLPEIQPGQTWEVFGQLGTTVDQNSLKFDLAYRANELGCLKVKEYGVSGGTVAQPCQLNTDCKSGFICCQNLCRDQSSGICRDINGDGIPDWIPK